MKTWKSFLAIALATVAVLLMTSWVIAAPASTGSVLVNRVYDDPKPVLSDTLPTTHPVGSVIAVYFNIPYTHVMALHDDGLGFGQIARAYLTARASGGALTPEQVLDMRLAGVGWGQIKKDYGVHPGGNGLGSIMENKHAPSQPEPTATSAPPEVKPGDNSSEGCPGNSCSAPGQQKPPKDKPPKDKPTKEPKK
jgi:hypothetical protein